MTVDLLNVHRTRWTVHTTDTLSELTDHAWIINEVGISATSTGGDGIAIYAATYTELADSFQRLADDLRAAAANGTPAAPQPPDVDADDRADLATLMHTLRERHPDATAVHFTTRTDEHHGFEISDLSTGTGLLSDEDPDALAILRDIVGDLAANLRWRGILHENKRGYAVIPLTTTLTGPRRPRLGP